MTRFWHTNPFWDINLGPHTRLRFFIDWREWMVGGAVHINTQRPTDPLGQWNTVRVSIGPLNVVLGWPQ